MDPRPPLSRMGSSVRSLRNRLKRTSSSMSSVLSRSASSASDLARSVASSKAIDAIIQGFKRMRVEGGPGSAALAEPQAAVLPFDPTPCPVSMPHEVYKLLLQVSAVQQTAVSVITPLETVLVSAVDPRRRRAVVTVGWVSGLCFVNCVETGGGGPASDGQGPPGRTRSKTVKKLHLQLIAPRTHGHAPATPGAIPPRPPSPPPGTAEPPRHRPATGDRPAAPQPAVPRVSLTPPPSLPPSPPPPPPPPPPLPTSPGSASAPQGDVPPDDAPPDDAPAPAPLAAPVVSGAAAQPRQRRPPFKPTTALQEQVAALEDRHAPNPVPSRERTQLADTFKVCKRALSRYFKRRRPPATAPSAATHASGSAAPLRPPSSTSATALTIAAPAPADDAAGATPGTAPTMVSGGGVPLEEPVDLAQPGSVAAPVPLDKPESVPAEAAQAPQLHLPPGRYDVEGLQWATRGNLRLLHVFACDPGVAEPISGVDIEDISKRVRMTTNQRNRACCTRHYAQMLAEEKPQALRECENQMKEVTSRENSLVARLSYYKERWRHSATLLEHYSNMELRARKRKAAIKRQVRRCVACPFFHQYATPDLAHLSHAHFLSSASRKRRPFWRTGWRGINEQPGH